MIKKNGGVYVKFFRKSILLKILGIFLSILVLSMVTLITYVSVDSKNMMNAFVSQTQRLIAAQLERSSEILFHNTERTLLSISRERSARDVLVSETYQQMLVEDFKKYQEMNTSITALMMGTDDDQFFIYPTSRQSKDYRPTEQIWYQKAMENRGRVVYTSPFIDETTGETVIVIATTVNKDFGVVGVVGAMLSVDLFQQMLEYIQIGNTGYAFAVDSEGDITAHKDARKIGTSLLGSTFFDKIQTIEQDFLTEVIDNQKQTMSFQANFRTGWHFVVAMEYEEIQHEIYKMILKNVFVFIGVLLIASLLSLWLAGSIVKPIRALANCMKQVQKGDLSVRIPVKLQDEIGELMHDFNRMIEQVRGLVQEIDYTCSTLMKSSSEYYAMADNNAATAQQVLASVSNISSGSDQQSVAAQKILSQIQAFASQISKITHNANHASDQALSNAKINITGIQMMQQLHANSQNNMDYVEQGVLEIEGLQHKSEAVVKIMQSIEKVAKQTNLISFNASIEAARAGEHGRGFSVIASEIQQLAQEVEMLSKKTYGYLAEMISQVAQTADSMKKTQKASCDEHTSMLEAEKILETIKDTSHVIEQEMQALYKSIDCMNEEKHHILEAVEEIAGISEEATAATQQIHAGVERHVKNNDTALSASEQLLNAAKSLKQKVRRFKI